MVDTKHIQCHKGGRASDRRKDLRLAHDAGFTHPQQHWLCCRRPFRSTRSSSLAYVTSIALGEVFPTAACIIPSWIMMFLKVVDIRGWASAAGEHVWRYCVPKTLKHFWGSNPLFIKGWKKAKVIFLQMFISFHTFSYVFKTFYDFHVSILFYNFS